MARVLQTIRFRCSRVVSSADFQRANADFGSKQLRLSIFFYFFLALAVRIMAVSDQGKLLVTDWRRGLHQPNTGAPIVLYGATLLLANNKPQRSSGDSRSVSVSVLVEVMACRPRSTREQAQWRAVILREPVSGRHFVSAEFCDMGQGEREREAVCGTGKTRRPRT